MPLPQTNKEKKEKKERSPITKAFIISGYMVLYSLAFNLFAWFFIEKSVSPLVKILVGFGFLFPAMIMCFARGVSTSEKEFKQLNNSALTNVHEHSYEDLSFGLPFLYVAPFAVIPTLVCLFGIITKINFFQSITTFFFMPGVLIYMGAGLYPQITDITWFALLAVGSVIILQSISFILGFFKGISNVKKNNKELASEIRTFD